MSLSRGAVAGARLTDAGSAAESEQRRAESAGGGVDAKLKEDRIVPGPLVGREEHQEFALSGKFWEDPSNNLLRPCSGGKDFLPFPDDIVQQGGTVDYYDLGLFAELGHAWVVLDNKFFLWNYEHEAGAQVGPAVIPVDDGIADCIFGVGLAMPTDELRTKRPNVVRVLVLVTAAEVRMYYVEIVPPAGERRAWDRHVRRGTLSVHRPGPEYIVPADTLCGMPHEVRVGAGAAARRPKVHIASTAKDGRIFLMGHDSHLHELIYRSEDNWQDWLGPAAPRKCRKYTHYKTTFERVTPSVFSILQKEPQVVTDLLIDESREKPYMYTLDKQGLLNAYDLSAGTCVHLGQTKPKGEKLVSIALVPDPTVTTKKDKSQLRGRPKEVCLLGLCEEKGTSSLLLQKFKLTLKQSGVFDLVGRITEQSKYPDQRGQRSGGAANFHFNRCSYAQDMALLVNDGEDAGTDFAMAIYSSCFVKNTRGQPKRGGEDFPKLMAEQFFVGQGVRAISEVPASLIQPGAAASLPLALRLKSLASLHDRADFETSTAAKLMDLERSLCEVSSQHILPRREFVILTRTGLYRFEKMRPIDQLQSFVQNPITKDKLRKYNDETKEKNVAPLKFAADDLCAMYVQLACEGGDGAAAADSRDVKQNAIELWEQRKPTGGKDADGDPSGSVSSLFGRTVKASTHFKSTRHSAVVLYVARLLRPLLDEKVQDLIDGSLGVPGRAGEFDDTAEILRFFSARLQSVRQFLHDRLQSENIKPDNHRSASSKKTPKTKHEAENEELDSVRIYVDAAIHALELLLLHSDREILRLCRKDVASTDKSWDEWEKLTLRSLIVKREANNRVFKVVNAINLRAMTSGKTAITAKALKSLKQKVDQLCGAASTFVRDADRHRMIADAYLRQAITLPDSDPKARDAVQRALYGGLEDEQGYQALLQDPSFGLRAHLDKKDGTSSLRELCNSMLHKKLQYFECFTGIAEMCMRRGTTLYLDLRDSDSKDGNSKEKYQELAECFGFILQMVSFLYDRKETTSFHHSEQSKVLYHINKPTHSDKKDLKVPRLQWSKGGLHPLQAKLAPPEASRESVANPAAKCRSAVLKVIFSPAEREQRDQLRDHGFSFQMCDMLYTFFLENDLCSSYADSAQGTDLQPMLFDCLHSDVKLVNLEDKLKQVSMGHGETPTWGATDRKATNLLCEYYRLTRQQSKAAEVCISLAIRTGEGKHPHLKERIELIEKAINYAKLSQDGAQRCVDWESTILPIWRLQQEMQDQGLERGDQEGPFHTVQDLFGALVNTTIMPLHKTELKLAVYNLALWPPGKQKQYQDKVVKLWGKCIGDGELCTSSSRLNWLSDTFRKRQYRDEVFPIQRLLPLLHSPDDNGDSETVWKTLYESCEQTYDELATAYGELLDQPTYDDHAKKQQRVSYLAALASLVADWFRTVNLPRSSRSDERQFSDFVSRGRLEDWIAHCDAAGGDALVVRARETFSGLL